jgi:hypothetical protein
MCANTKLIRAIMRKFGRTEIWTNKYKTCRTVKCYVGKRNAEMEKSIAKKLGAAGVKFSIKTIPGYAMWARDSFIVTVPLE